MEDLARINHRFQPGAAFGRALNGEEQREQTFLVGRACVFAEGLPQREMLGFGVCRKPVRVGCEKRERRLLILAVFGEIEMYSANEVPCGVATFQEVLN